MRVYPIPADQPRCLPFHPPTGREQTASYRLHLSNSPSSVSYCSIFRRMKARADSSGPSILFGTSWMTPSRRTRRFPGLRVDIGMDAALFIRDSFCACFLPAKKVMAAKINKGSPQQNRDCQGTDKGKIILKRWCHTTLLFAEQAAWKNREYIQITFRYSFFLLTTGFFTGTLLLDFTDVYY